MTIDSVIKALIASHGCTDRELVAAITSLVDELENQESVFEVEKYIIRQADMERG